MNKNTSLLAFLLVAILAVLFFAPSNPQAAGLAIPPATTSEATGVAGVTITCGSDAEGNYAELIAATAAASYYQTITISSASANNQIIDIATGSAGNESVKINNLAITATSGADLAFGLPMSIPLGSRVAARCHGVGGVASPVVYWTAFE